MLWIGGVLVPMTALLVLLLYAQRSIFSEKLNQFDEPKPADMPSEPISQEYQRCLTQYKDVALPGGGAKVKLAALREHLDRFGSREGEADFGVAFVTTIVGAISAEWVLPPNYTASHRILYLHGGAFYVGSAKSHRTITSELAKQTGAALLAINYRLLPENKRRDTIADSQEAYNWILGNGPDGPGSVVKLAVAGDSAGGNLTLMLSAWSREAALRSADAVVAFAPAADSALASPSMRNNIETDEVLGPVMKMFMRFPLAILYLMNWILLRSKPHDRLLSPLRSKLDGLPPTLIQVSSSELLFDDAVRYTNKANAEGSHVTLQVWPNRAHVFQIFGCDVPESREALALAGEFLRAQGLSASD